MNKILLSLLAALFAFGAGVVCSAQEETPSKLKFYGFIRNYMVFDSREVNAGTQDLYFYMPKDSKVVDGVDQNAVPSFRMMSLTTRLGLNITGYQIGKTKVNGTIEADFYSMNGSVATFRMRQAYVGITRGNLLVNVGQTWHPMAADMPHMTNLETGAPFNPFNRSPQVIAHLTTGKFTWTGGILYPMQFLPVGPDGANTVKSGAFNKYGMIPEVYLGVAFQSGGFLGKAGVDFFSIMPRWNAPVIVEASIRDGEKILEYDPSETEQIFTRLFAVSPFLYLQFTAGKFQVKAKTILAQSGEHMNLLSGYGPTFDWNKMRLTYTPMQDWASFISFQYGKKFQVLGMAGYMQRLGTTRKLFGYDSSAATIWLNTAADARIQKAFRATPTIAYNLGKLTFSLEYNCTAGWFGEGYFNQGGLFETGHWVMNHRIEQMVRFNF
ncbi:MAG: hypothetical protein II874_01430 [Bacteroidales bacterium]|nr:hypothetical protein [Bacteroidales bacterium]